MLFTTKIMLASVNNLTDARFAAAAGLDFLGFNFEKGHPGFIEPVKAKEVVGWVSGPLLVGEFSSYDADDINSVAGYMNLDYVLVKSGELDHLLPGIQFPLMLGIDMNELGSFEELSMMLARLHSKVNYFVISNLTDEKVSGDLLQEYNVLWKPSGNPQDIKTEFAKLKPAGLVLNGMDETQIGIRNFEELSETLEMFREETL